MQFYMPVRLITGNNVVRSNGAALSAFGRRCLIVTGGSSAKTCGALDDVTAALSEQSIAYTVYDGIRQNPTMASCLAGGQIGADFCADFVVGVGGGSPLDAAKVIAVCIANPEAAEDALYRLEWTNRPVPIVLVGTTAGTGSEVTSVAVITNSEGRKRSVRGNDLYAVLSFGDPRYTATMPHAVTASTGVDALCHCAESFWSKPASDVSRALAAEGIRLLVPALEQVASGITPDAQMRESLYSASILGGMAISVTGTCAPHTIGYLLSEQYGVPHGFACACFLTAFLRHSEAAAPEVASLFRAKTGMDIARIESLLQKLLPPYHFHLSDAELDALLPRWPLTVPNLAKTPGTCDSAVVKTFLRSVFAE